MRRTRTASNTATEHPRPPCSLPIYLSINRSFRQIMSASSSDASQKYLYAITQAGAFGETSVRGIQKKPLYAIEDGDLAVIASSLSDGRVRPRRRNLKAHHDAIDALVDQQIDLLPMAFGSIADSAAELRAFLRAHQDELVCKIQQLRDRVEVQVRVAWKVDDIFQYFVRHNDELRATRDQYFRHGDRDPTRQEKMHLGELFSSVLESERAAHRATVEEHVGMVSDQLYVDQCRDESEVVRITCLVERDRVDELEEAIHTAAAQFSEHFVFNYTDHTAPYTFAQVEM